MATIQEQRASSTLTAFLLKDLCLDSGSGGLVMRCANLGTVVSYKLRLPYPQGSR